MKRGLGKGLDELFSIYSVNDGNLAENENANDNGVFEIDMRLIDPNKDQPRKKFDAASLKELGESIRQHGVIQPIILSKTSGGRYVIIAGERRFRASLSIGMKQIPAIVRDYTPKQVKEVALIENLQREDLNPIEAARAIKELMLEYDFTQDEVADRIGKSRPLVANTLRLLTLNNNVVEMIENGKISAGHGRMLASIAENDQFEVANLIVSKKMSVRDLEKYVQNYHNNSAAQKQVVVKQSAELKELGHRFQRIFGTKVLVKGTDGKGKLVLEYFSVDDLNRFENIISKLEKLL